MAVIAAVGSARTLDGREAGLQAAHQALNKLGNSPPVLGIIVASHLYDPQQVTSGIGSLIGNTPMIGFSSPVGLTLDGLNPHSVVVALIASTETRVDVTWLADYTRGTRDASQQLADLLRRKPHQSALLFADGYSADAQQLCANLPAGTNLSGALSSGDLNAGSAYQIGGSQSGAGGLALARLEGDIRIGVGVGTGWQSVGAHFRVTRSDGLLLQRLDEHPAAEAYAHLFGYPASEWASPPLNSMVHMYPLGVEQADKSLLIRSPLRVEADGSFRMNAVVNEGTEAFLHVGSLAACRKAAAAAAKQALAALEGARPVLALVLADVAWQMLFEAQAGADVSALQAALGPDIPLVGGYTLGQIVPHKQASPQFLNQQMLVVVFGETKVEK